MKQLTLPIIPLPDGWEKTNYSDEVEYNKKIEKHKEFPCPRCGTQVDFAGSIYDGEYSEDGNFYSLECAKCGQRMHASSTDYYTVTADMEEL